MSNRPATFRAALHPLAWLITAAALTGCGTVRDISVHDKNSAAYAARATIRPDAWKRSETTHHGIEVGYEGFKAEDTQSLQAGDTLTLGTGFINGPAMVRHDARYSQYHVAYSPLIKLGSNVELEPFVGAAKVRLKLHSVASAGGAAIDLDESRNAAIGGITPRWRFNDWLAVETRIALTSGAWGSGQNVEVALALNPVPQLGLRLGYSDRRQKLEETFINAFSSEVHLRARGPMATLQLSF